MSERFALGDLTFVTMSPLEGQAVALDICSRCHTKTLRTVVESADCTAKQCAKCLRVFFVEVMRGEENNNG